MKPYSDTLPGAATCLFGWVGSLEHGGYLKTPEFKGWSDSEMTLLQWIYVAGSYPWHEGVVSLSEIFQRSLK